MTRRQFRAWIQHMNQPSLTDYYLMQLTRECHLLPGRVWGGKDPEGLGLDAFELRSKPPKPPTIPSSLPRGFPRVATKADVERASMRGVMGAINYQETPRGS